MIFRFIVLLSTLAHVPDIASLFVNDEPWMVRPTHINMNPVELQSYSFMISLNKFTKCCNVFSPKETKNIYVKEVTNCYYLYNVL